MLRKIAGQIARFCGARLYTLGFNAEYLCVVALRFMRSYAWALAHVLVLLFTALWGSLKALAIGIGQ